MSRPLQAWLVRLSFAGVIAATLGYLPYRLFDGSGVRDLPAMRQELVRIRGEVSRLRRENAALRREIVALRNDPAAVEDLARDRLGMVRPDEIVVRVAVPAGSAQ